VVNAVSLYVEHGTETFHSLHVECAQRLGNSSMPSRSRAASPRFRNRCRRRLTIALCSQAWRRRTSRPGRVRRCTSHPSGGDVRTGRLIFNHYHHAPGTASNLSNVWPRPHQITAGLCGRCGGGDHKGTATDGKTSDHI
jgi:hypothetical protein